MLTLVPSLEHAEKLFFINNCVSVGFWQKVHKDIIGNGL